MAACSKIEVQPFLDSVLYRMLTFLYGCRVKIRLAVELGSLELIRFLNIHASILSDFGSHKVPCGLPTYPAGRQIGNLACWNKIVHILIQINRGLVPVNSDTFFELHYLTENIIAQPL